MLSTASSISYGEEGGGEGRGRGGWGGCPRSAFFEVGLLHADDMALTSSSAIGLQHMVTALNGALKAWGPRSAPRNQDAWYLVRTTTPLASPFKSKARRWTRWTHSAILAPLSLRTEHAQLQSTTAPRKPGSDSTKAISFGACAA